MIGSTVSKKLGQKATLTWTSKQPLDKAHVQIVANSTSMVVCANGVVPSWFQDRFQFSVQNKTIFLSITHVESEDKGEYLLQYNKTKVVSQLAILPGMFSFSIRI